MRRSAILASGVLVLLTGFAGLPAAQAAPAETKAVIVQLRSPADVRPAASEATRGGGNVKHVYKRVLDGFAAELPAQAVEALQRNPRVKSVTPDAETRPSATQTSPPWGLDRVDQRAAALDSAYSYDTTGTGVTVYVVDSGVRFTHTEFGGRVQSGYDFVDDDTDASDCSGHGTHVSGTVLGSTYGVAKQARAVSLRVFPCSGSGSYSDVIAAFDYAVANRQGPSVINFSGGGGAYVPMDDAVARTTAAGITVVVAAANDNQDACNKSPARAPSAITVGATDSADARASFSNYGSCVDVFAPGVSVLSGTVTSDTSSGYKSGTSMATPHVAGVVARYLQDHPAASPAEVTGAIGSTATTGIVTNSLSAKNHLLHVAPPAPPKGPDLVVTDVSWSPASPVAGSPVRFRATIKNQGDVATQGGVTHGVLFKVNGAAVSFADSWNASLAPGASVTLTANGGPAGETWAAKAGTHTVEAKVDDINRLPGEANETNNARTRTMTVGAAPAKADLVVTSVSSSPVSPAVGAPVRFSATIKNQGTAATASGIAHRVLFKVDGVNKTWSDTRTASLAAGASVTLTANAGGTSGTWPATSGPHTVQAIVDDLAKIAEQNDANNTKDVQLTVGSVINRPDLVVTALTWSPSMPTSTKPVRFSATIKNQGTLTTPNVIHGVGFRINGAAVAFSDTSKVPLRPGESVTLTANGGPTGGTWTATTGTHTLQAHVDDINRITGESNEGNNLMSRVLIVP